MECDTPPALDIVTRALASPLGMVRKWSDFDSDLAKTWLPFYRNLTAIRLEPDRDPVGIRP